MFFSFNLKNTSLHIRVSLMSRRSFPLCFSVFCTATACCRSQRASQRGSSLDALSGGTQNACLHTIYSSLDVDSLVSKMLIMWSIWTTAHIDFINVVKLYSPVVYVVWWINVLHQEEGKCWQLLVPSSWNSNCFKLIRTSLTLILSISGDLKPVLSNTPVHK